MTTVKTDKQKMTILEKLFHIQQELDVPKWQTNKFGWYKYRSCEDIVQAVKPILKDYWCVLKLTDEVVQKWDRYYVRAVASLIDVATGRVEYTTWEAREEESKKGMDWSQITWASSSYARKYALNWLLGIDDTKDSDATNDHWKNETPKEEVKPAPKQAAKPKEENNSVSEQQLDCIRKFRWEYKDILDDNWLLLAIQTVTKIDSLKELTKLTKLEWTKVLKYLLQLSQNEVDKGREIKDPVLKSIVEQFNSKK